MIKCSAKDMFFRDNNRVHSIDNMYLHRIQIFREVDSIVIGGESDLGSAGFALTLDTAYNMLEHLQQLLPGRITSGTDVANN